MNSQRVSFPLRLLLCLFLAGAQMGHAQKVVKSETVDLQPGECFSTEVDGAEEFRYNISVAVTDGPTYCLRIAKGLYYKGECLSRDIDDYSKCRVPGRKGFTSANQLCENWDEISVASSVNEYSASMCVPDDTSYFAMKSICSEDSITVEYQITTQPLTQSEKDLCEAFENFLKAAAAGLATAAIVGIVLLIVFVLAIIGCIIACCFCPGCPLNKRRQNMPPHAAIAYPSEGYQMTSAQPTGYGTQPPPDQQFTSKV